MSFQISNDFGDYNWVLDSNYDKKLLDYVTLTNCFTEKECDLINEYGFVKYGKDIHPAQTTSGLNNEVRKSNVVMFPNDDKETSWIFNKLSDVINNINRQVYNYDLKCIELLQFTNYDSTDRGYYKKHVDSLYGILSRKLSFTLQLSDENSYEGGDLCLYFNHEPDKMLKQRGSITFFPSYVLHEVTPVTKGTRNSLVGWVLGPDFK